jgi:hypothetical protein
MQTARGRSNQLFKQIGEYLVASELARRGLLVATFSGNVPDFDLIATDLKGFSCPIQVKTVKGGAWQFSIDKFVEITFDGKKQLIGRKKPLLIPQLVCVFVLAGEKYGKDQFFVLEWSKVQDILIAHHARFLDSHAGVRPKVFDSLHCSLEQSELRDYKDNWRRASKVSVTRERWIFDSLHQKSLLPGPVLILVRILSL